MFVLEKHNNFAYENKFSFKNNPIKLGHALELGHIHDKILCPDICCVTHYLTSQWNEHSTFKKGILKKWNNIFVICDMYFVEVKIYSEKFLF